VRPGDYFFDIGTAGATSLVLQTLLLALVPGTSSVTVQVRPPSLVVGTSDSERWL
jgi:RNA 3'-terminal phosphate cyclase